MVEYNQDTGINVNYGLDNSNEYDEGGGNTLDFELLEITAGAVIDTDVNGVILTTDGVRNTISG